MSASTSTAHAPFPSDIYTEPKGVDVNTLANLGPLSGMAGVWQGVRGLDVKPKAEGAKMQAYVERIELQPIDPQTNGPQLFYGLRYHTHVTKPEQVKTYHDQVGYWLWEPATGTVVHTLTIAARRCSPLVKPPPMRKPSRFAPPARLGRSATSPSWPTPSRRSSS